MSKDIILLEDEEKIGKLTCAYLDKEGYKVDWYKDGKEGWEALKDEPDLLVLDLMLPGMEGEEICKKLRSRGSQIPILMLTARGTEEDRIKGLEIGADDYLVKPFSLRELVARINAIMRRYQKSGEALADRLTFKTGNNKRLEIDLTHQVVEINDQQVELTTTEFNLLSILAQNPGRPFTRDELIVKLQGYNYEGFDRAIDAHIKNLRRKLKIKSDQFIITIYGVGYKFSEGKE